VSAPSVGLALLVRRSLRQHALSTAITVVCAALASGLTMAVFAFNAQARDAFTARPGEFDGVLGARGSPLQLVLNAVFHLETSPGNLQWSEYEEIRSDPGVEKAVPYALGDSHRGFRIVGTTPDAIPSLGMAVAPPGRIFDAAAREAVVGSFVAQRTGLAYGSKFHPSHGLAASGEEHEDEYVVVGVLRPSGTAADRVVWIPVEGVFRMEGHELRGTGAAFRASATEAIPDEVKEVSAVMLKLRDPMSGLRLADRYRRESRTATLAWPVDAVMADLFAKLGWAHLVLGAVAWLVVVVAAASILASITNTIHERRREFAILRAIGAHRSTVSGAIVLEAASIAAMGAALGFVVYAGIVAAAAAVVREQTGVVLDVVRFHPIHVAGPVGMVVLGGIAGILPAAKAYATDVAQNLGPTS
jgi:putative ABC transport system permease protein